MKNKIELKIDEDGTFSVKTDGTYIMPSNQELEEILCAIKQTQKKLVNIQIQDLQDSKKNVSMSDCTLSHVSALEFTDNAKLYFDGNNLMLVKPDGTRVKLG